MENNENDFYIKQDNILAARNSYIKKQDFIDIISKLPFDSVETATIHFITGYQFIPATQENDEYIKTYGFDFDIY